MSIPDPGLTGIWLLIAGVAAIVLEGALGAWWAVRLSRRAAALRTNMNALQAQIRGDLATLDALLAETRVLWRPYRRLLRLLRHPITIALMQSYARRRAG